MAAALQQIAQMGPEQDWRQRLAGRLLNAALLRGDSLGAHWRA